MFTKAYIHLTERCAVPLRVQLAEKVGEKQTGKQTQRKLEQQKMLMQQQHTGTQEVSNASVALSAA